MLIFIGQVRALAENLNLILGIIVAIITILGALCGGVLFIWRASGNLNGVLANLNNGISRLNEHLSRVETRADKTDLTLAEHNDLLTDHDKRITILEKGRVNNYEN